MHTEDKQVSERKLYLDLLRVVATIAVVFIHVESTYWYGTDVTMPEWQVYNIWNGFLRWAVPVFVMISGALFLQPQKEISIKKLYFHNVFRIVVAALFWGLIYAIRRKQNAPEIGRTEFVMSIVDGQYHMWFLYMVIGLYIATPILRVVVRDEKAIKYFLVVSFFTTIGVSTYTRLGEALIQCSGNYYLTEVINTGIGVWTDMRYHFTVGYVFYYVLGYYLNNRIIEKNYRVGVYILGMLSAIVMVWLSAMISLRLGRPWALDENFELPVCMQSIAVFILFGNIKLDASPKWKELIYFLSRISFGIYLVHELMIQVVMENMVSVNGIWSSIMVVPALSLLVFGVSAIISFVIGRIPIVGKYIV